MHDVIVHFFQGAVKAILFIFFIAIIIVAVGAFCLGYFLR